MKFVKDKKLGAVYCGVYLHSKRPPLSDFKYVIFSEKDSQIRTAKYQYFFNPKNYLVVRGLNIIDARGIFNPLILSSSFSIHLDMKYFLTLDIDSHDIKSELEAYKLGPVRMIARVNFSYSL